MAGTFTPLFSDAYLWSEWQTLYEAFRADEEPRLLQALRQWDARAVQKETSAAPAFISVFFKGIWGYTAAGETDAAGGYTCTREYSIDGAGKTGAAGSADLALGWFAREGVPGVPQVLCEFKDYRSGLDQPQHRADPRTPVEQCEAYLREAANAVPLASPVKPAWAVVTDMNEFRLYCRRNMPAQSERFFIRAGSGDGAVSLLDDSDAASFQRFLFWRMFRPGMLLSTGGPSPLERLLEEQWIQEKALEKTFYQEYHAYRQSVFEAVVAANPNFTGRRSELVRLTQRFLDRCIFILFCEDMGQALQFPHDLLRDTLMSYSKLPHFPPDGDAAWSAVRDLFRAMAAGGTFSDKRINAFNGGLFADDPLLESLHVPNRVFCVRNQADEDQLRRHPDTLLYLAATYNFGLSGDTHERTIGLYALGRIFEQSITDLEVMEAHADNRTSLMELTKRKRDGVYYTPETITKYIVEQTVGARLADMRREIGLPPAPPSDDEIAAYQKWKKNPRRRGPTAVVEYLQMMRTYQDRLREIKIVDPACGSGAFLIQALEYLQREWKQLRDETGRIEGEPQIWNPDAVIRSILGANLYGVDINPESVEITQLSLWLHTASPGKTLCALDHNIRCGNSLVGSAFRGRQSEALFDADQWDRINTFDWWEAFPEVRARGGFDCVIGNPPYVKLQHFRAVSREMAAVAEYLVNARRADGRPLYESTQTGNFDMYLPFIEKGVELLRPDGRMGYIAPSLWLKNKYGLGLRQKVKRTRALDRWIDFKSFQVFDEATTYTALQFFRGQPCDAIRFVLSPDGGLPTVDWDADAERMAYDELAAEGPWNVMRSGEAAILARLSRECLPLGDGSVTRQIFQGIITSVDSVYHLRRIAPGRYASKKGDGEYAIEDAIMHPLVSGPDAKRYERPAPDIFLLFPYVVEGGKAGLSTQAEMASRFPKAWAYLRSHEQALRGRERGSFDDDQWYRFGRNQNIDKQEFAKLGVAETVPRLRLFADHAGEFFFNNVRVNGILPACDEDIFFLLGVLNSPVADYCFRHTAKSKAGGFFEANKQFIAPLPIPRATPAQKAEVAARAERLQSLHTERRDLVERLDHALDSGDSRKHKKRDWLPSDKVEARAGEIDACLHADATLGVDVNGGELRVLVDGVAVIDGIYPGRDQLDFIAAQWRHFARTTHVTQSFNTRKLLRGLLTLTETANPGLREEVIALDRDLAALDARIQREEDAMNALVYSLYRLTDDEIRLVEAADHQ